MNMNFEPEEDSFIVLGECPEESIAQLSLENLTVDQAVYTIGTLTQRIEQLTEAMDQMSVVRSAGDSPSGSFQSVYTRRPQVESSTQTLQTATVDAATERLCELSESAQQTELFEEHLVQKSARDTICDLQTAMERLSAEKMTYLTSLAERDRRINALKDELRKTKSEKGALEEVLESHSSAMERTELALNDTETQLQSKELVVRQLEEELAASREEALSLRYAAQMMMQDRDALRDHDAVMVDPTNAQPPIAYPYHSVPQDRRYG